MPTWDDEPERLDAILRQIETFNTASVDELNSQPEASSEDKQGFDLAKSLKREKVRKASQENDLRGRFFLWTFLLASVIIGANFALMAYYTVSLKGEVPKEVMMFWISATVVQILGIVYIIAQYLFPKPNKK